LIALPIGMIRIWGGGGGGGGVTSSKIVYSAKANYIKYNAQGNSRFVTNVLVTVKIGKNTYIGRANKARFI
jgi:hypothetical protein